MSSDQLPAADRPVKTVEISAIVTIRITAAAWEAVNPEPLTAEAAERFADAFCADVVGHVASRPLIDKLTEGEPASRVTVRKWL